MSLVGAGYFPVVVLPEKSTARTNGPYLFPDQTSDGVRLVLLTEEYLALAGASERER